MLEASIKQFKYYKQLADKAISQLQVNDYLFHQENPEDNSIAIIISHMAGNMKSRWTNIFTEDGEKPWRNRDAEFESVETSKEDLFRLWEEGWDILFTILQTLCESDLKKIIYIRNDGMSVEDVIIRQLCHYSYHCGQIVYKCKQLTNGSWSSLSIPKNHSEAYNKKKFSAERQKRHFLDKMPEDD